MKYEDIKPGMVLLEEMKAYDLTRLAKCYSIILKKSMDSIKLLEVFEVKTKGWVCELRTVYEKNWDTKGWWRSRRVNRVMFFNSLFQIDTD